MLKNLSKSKVLRKNAIVSFLVVGSIITTIPTVHGKMNVVSGGSGASKTQSAIIVSTEAIVKFQKELSKEQLRIITKGLNAKVIKLKSLTYSVSSSYHSFESMKQFFKDNYKKIPYVYVEENSPIIVRPIQPDPSKPDPIIVRPIQPDPSKP